MIASPDPCTGLNSDNVRRIKIKHLTEYRFAETVTLQPHNLHLRPRDGFDIRVVSSSLDITPATEIRWKRDVYGNSVATADLSQRSSDLIIDSEIVIEHYSDVLPKFALEDYAQRFPFQYDPRDSIDLYPYKSLIFPEDEAVIRDWISDVYQPDSGLGTIFLLTCINQKIANQLRYEMREEPGVQSPAETLRLGSGSCRDFATLFNEICRHLGLAMRFISGYVLGDAVPQQIGSTHAWSEVFLPGSGWRGFDPTSGLLASSDHIAVAVHRHPESIPPVAGSYIGTGNANPQMFVDVRVSLLP